MDPQYHDLLQTTINHLDCCIIFILVVSVAVIILVVLLSLLLPFLLLPCLLKGSKLDLSDENTRSEVNRNTPTSYMGRSMACASTICGLPRRITFINGLPQMDEIEWFTKIHLVIHSSTICGLPTWGGNTIDGLLLRGNDLQPPPCPGVRTGRGRLSWPHKVADARRDPCSAWSSSMTIV